MIAPPCESANLVEYALLRPRCTGRWRHTTADNRITHGCKGVSWKMYVWVVLDVHITKYKYMNTTGQMSLATELPTTRGAAMQITKHFFPSEMKEA